MKLLAIFKRCSRYSFVRVFATSIVLLLAAVQGISAGVMQSPSQRPLFDDLRLYPGTGMQRLRDIGLGGTQVLAFEQLARRLDEMMNTLSVPGVVKNGKLTVVPQAKQQSALRNAATAFVGSFALLVASSDQSDDLAPMSERHLRTFEESVRAQDFKAIEVLVRHFDTAEAELRAISIAKSRVARGAGSDVEKTFAARDRAIAAALYNAAMRTLKITSSQMTTRADEADRYVYCVRGKGLIDSSREALQCRNILLRVP